MKRETTLTTTNDTPCHKMTTANDIIDTMTSMRDEQQRTILMRFFKTGKGQYGEGDEFLGIKVPQTRLVAKEAGCMQTDEIEKLLYSQWHEVRLCGFLILVKEMKRHMPSKRTPAGNTAEMERIAQFYLAHARQANNWDLVDLSCQYIIGPWLLLFPDMRSSILDRLTKSNNLWEQRISIVTTLAFIRENQFDDTLRISRLLLNHPHDLIHKAVGWMLRETGKRDIDTLRHFLTRHATEMPRTTLRYAIEKMEKKEQEKWLKTSRK